MKVFGIEVNVRNCPALDPDFVPLKLFHDAYRQGAQIPVKLALERQDGVAVCESRIRGGAENLEADCYYMDRLVKNLLW